MDFFVLAIFLLVAIPSSVYEVIRRRIPGIFAIFGFVMIAAYYFVRFGFQPDFLLKKVLPGFLGNILVLALVHFLISGSLSFGGVLLGGFSGLCVPFPWNFAALAVSALSMLIFYLFSKTVRKFKSNGGVILKTRFSIPFVPFLTFGTALTLILFL